MRVEGWCELYNSQLLCAGEVGKNLLEQFKTLHHDLLEQIFCYFCALLSHPSHTPEINQKIEALGMILSVIKQEENKDIRYILVSYLIRHRC